MKKKESAKTHMSQVIKVKKSGGETLTIQVAADATIEDIKCKIAQVDKH